MSSHSVPWTARGQVADFFRVQPHITNLLTKTFPAPLLAPSLGLNLRSALSHLSDLILRLQSEHANPASPIFRNDGKFHINMLLTVAGVGLLDALDEVESLVRIQTTAGDGSEMRWWNWVASLKMVGLDRDGEAGGLVGASKKLAEVAWRLEWLFKALPKPTVQQILPRLSNIRETFNNVVLNHQWLYFPASRDDGTFDSDSIRTTTPSLYSNLRSKFGPRVASDAASEYSVNTFTTTTTTRDRIDRNKGALDMEIMVRKFQEAAASGTENGAIPEASKFVWKTKADSLLLILMHWVHEAATGLEPYLKYHTSSTVSSTPGQTPEPLPVQGYVNLVKCAWILQIIDPVKAPLGNELGEEGKTMIGLLTCEVINLFQVIHEHEFDLPTAEATLAQGNYTVVIDGLPEQQRTPTRSSTSSPYSGEAFAEELAKSGVGSAVPSLALSVEHNESSGSSTTGSAGGGAQYDSNRRGRSSAIREDDADSSSRPRRTSQSRGSSVGAKMDGRGRSRGHWRSFSSSFSSSEKDRQPASIQSSMTVPNPQPERAMASIYHRRPSTSASTSSTPAATSSHQSTFARVFSPFSTSLPSSKISSRSSVKQRSRSPSPSPLPSTYESAHQGRPSQGTTRSAPFSHNDSSSPSSTRGYVFPKLPFQSTRERDRTRSGLITGSLVSLTGSIVEALGDKTKGVYATKPLPPLDPLPVQATISSHPNNSRVGFGDDTRDREMKYSGTRSTGFSWNERETLTTLGGAREGETEIMPKALEDILLLTSYTGELHGGRWDNCRIRIYTKQTPGPNGTFGTAIRLVTVNLTMEGSVDQRNLFLENTELVPEYAYHENWPVIYLRQITNIRRNERKNSTKLLKGVTSSNSGTVTTLQASGWDDCSLFYKFTKLKDMFTFQLAMLGEVVETDIRCIPTVRYKRNFLDGEHTHYRARIQIWRDNPNKTITTVSQFHGQCIAGRPTSPTMATSVPSSGRALPNPISAPVKIHNSRLVIYWEGGGGVMMFLTDSIDIETRSNTSAASIPNGNNEAVQNANRPMSPTSQFTSTTNSSTDPPTGNYVLRIKPSAHFSKPFKNPSSIKAHLLSPPPIASQSSGIRLDKQGLTLEDEENSSSSVGGWDEYRWFEVEFQTEKEMTMFMEDFKRLINERRKERRRREEIAKGSKSTIGLAKGAFGMK